MPTVILDSANFEDFFLKISGEWQLNLNVCNCIQKIPEISNIQALKLIVIIEF